MRTIVRRAEPPPGPQLEGVPPPPHPQISGDQGMEGHCPGPGVARDHPASQEKKETEKQLNPADGLVGGSAENNGRAAAFSAPRVRLSHNDRQQPHGRGDPGPGALRRQEGQAHAPSPGPRPRSGLCAPLSRPATPLRPLRPGDAGTLTAHDARRGPGSSQGGGGPRGPHSHGRPRPSPRRAGGSGADPTPARRHATGWLALPGMFPSWPGAGPASSCQHKGRLDELRMAPPGGGQQEAEALSAATTQGRLEADAAGRASDQNPAPESGDPREPCPDS
nr:uncharacterized protein LOC111767619 [Equus caballus]